MLLASVHGTGASRDLALNELCRTYWRPVYEFVRQRRQNDEEAKDLTQTFFESLLTGDWLASVDHEKGKFRSFLLVVLKRFLINASLYETRAKRGGCSSFLPFDEVITAPELTSPELTPEQAYDRRWALTVISRAGDRLRAEHAEPEAKRRLDILLPYIEEPSQSGDDTAASTKIGLSPEAVAMAVYRLRKRFRELVRVEVARTIALGESVEEELTSLIRALRPPPR